MTHILIPTDFTTRSVSFAEEIANDLPDKCSIIFFHAFDVPESLLHAIHKSGLRNHHNLITEELRTECRKLSQRCRQIVNISYRIMYGNSLAVFRNHVESNNIDLIYVPFHYRFTPISKESVDICKWVGKTNADVIYGIDLLANNDLDAHQHQSKIKLQSALS